MQNMMLIAKRDLKMYFISPIAYIIIAVFLFLMGWMFFNLLSYYSQSLQQFGAISYGQKPTLSENVIRPLYGNMNVIMLFIVPFITMRLIAEERKDHTVELLLTAPIRSLDVILGKFLSGFALLAIMLSCTLIYPIMLFYLTKPDLGVVLGCYMGLLLVAATYVAVGLFWSARTENQIVAAALSFGTLLFLWLISWAAHRAGPVWSDVLNGFSIVGHYSNFSEGVIDTTDLVFYASAIGFSLFGAKLSFDTAEWG